MSYIPVTSARIPSALANHIVLGNIQATQREMLIEQGRLSSGKQIPLPSYDPFGASITLSLQGLLERKTQAQTNVGSARTFLEATDAALSDLNDMIAKAQEVASSNVGTIVSDEEREASAQVIESLLDQIVSIGNRRFGGRYLFGGQNSNEAPFLEALSGYFYAGDEQEINVSIDLNETFASNIPGSRIFGAVSQQVDGWVDLNPQLTAQTQLADLDGGSGVSRGSVKISDGAITLTVDLSTADNIQDVADIIENTGPAGITVSISPAGDGLQLQKAGADLTVTEVGTGTTARDLGILRETGAGDTLVGSDVDRAVSLLTPLADLNDGAGIDQLSGLVLSNGGQTTVVDLTTAVTVEDLLNEINGAGLYVRADVNDARNGLDVRNRVSGADMTIGENGGTTATDLGIRSLHAQTELDALNEGRGIRTMDGQTDFLITRRDGVAFEVDITTAETIQDVIDLVNAAPGNTGGLLVAGQAANGNGIALTDASVGAEDLRVEAINASMAAADLGLAQQVANPGDTLVQEDVNPIHPRGLLAGLIELRDGLLGGDPQQMTWAAEQLTETNATTAAVRAEIGIRIQAMEMRERRLQDEQLEINQVLAEVYDLDYAESVTNYQMLQNAFEAALRSAQTVLQLSLVDLM